MSFLEKMKPHLLSDDPIVLEFVMQALQEYPNIPSDWSVLLLREALHSKEKEQTILTNIDRFPFNDEAVELIVQGFHAAGSNKKHLYSRLVADLEPEMILRNRSILNEILTSKEIDFNKFLLNGSEEEVWEEYGSILAAMENEEKFRPDLYATAKRLVRTLVKRGWIEEWEIDNTFKEQLDKKYFAYNGILAVYMVGLMSMEQFVPILAMLLNRDEDILLEEVSDALIAIQSDQVVESVADMMNGTSEDYIFPVSVLANTKSPLAVEKLRELYQKMNDNEDRMMIIEAMCHQLADADTPEIEQFAKEEYDSYLIETEKLWYGFYKVMGVDHPNFHEWMKISIEKDEEQRKHQMEVESLNGQKVGRNEPCPCGSGKKYKKCCGANE
jgi:hypothetical protein